MIDLQKKTDCCGCIACYSVCKHDAITLTSDEQGFVYPKFNKEKCVNCGLCDNVCPQINYEKRNINFLYIYALRLKDKVELKKSSSGGAFYAIASHVIKNLKGIVFGVSYDKKMIVRHTYTDTIEGLNAFHGSKYVQSNTTGVYEQVREFLNKGRFVLFTGTPCQNMALKLYLKKDYDNLFLVDIICHSVPSPLIFKEYVKFVEKKYRRLFFLPRKLVAIDMRNKSKGWNHAFYYYYHFSDGFSVRKEDLKVEHWGKLFFSGLITRPSCNECKFTNYRRVGDITIADFWDDDKKRPDIYSSEGTSLFIISTKKGLNTLKAIGSTVDLWELTKEESFQPCLDHPVNRNPLREQFWDYHNNHGFKKSYNKYFKRLKKRNDKSKVKNYLSKIPFIYNLLRWIKNLIK